MKCLLVLILLIISYNSHSQKIYADKQASLEAIKMAGKVYQNFQGDDNIAIYDKIDEFGKFKVMHYFSDDKTAKVVLLARDAVSNVDRHKSIFTSVANRSNIKYDHGNLNKLTIKNTSYYDGWASFEMISSADKNLYYIEIYLVD